MRHLGVGVGMVLVAALATGCGGDAPSNASEKEFCEAYNGLYDNLADIGSEDPEKAVDAMQEWADGMADTGTPEDISDEAREGFELIVENVQDIDGDVTVEELEKIGEDFSKEEEQAVEEFSTYATETCPMEMPDLPELPDMSDMESDLDQLEGDLEQQMDELESEMDELTQSP